MLKKLLLLLSFVLMSTVGLGGDGSTSCDINIRAEVVPYLKFNQESATLDFGYVMPGMWNESESSIKLDLGIQNSQNRPIKIIMRYKNNSYRINNDVLRLCDNENLRFHSSIKVTNGQYNKFTSDIKGYDLNRDIKIELSGKLAVGKNIKPGTKINEHVYLKAYYE